MAYRLQRVPTEERGNGEKIKNHFNDSDLHRPI